MQWKATLLNSASHDMFGWSGPPNNDIGRGFMDLFLHYSWYVQQDRYVSGIVTATSPKFFHVSPGIASTFDRFTLHWPRGFAYLDDLDLEVWSETTGTKIASSHSSLDNIEFLLGADFGQAGDNVFKVRSHSLNLSQVPFGLASSNFIYSRTPPGLAIASVNVQAPSINQTVPHMTANIWYPVTVTVENTGGLRARSVTLQIQGSPGIVISPLAPQVIASIAAGYARA